MWSFFDEFIIFFSDFLDFTSFLSDAYGQLPPLVGFTLGFIIIISTIAGTVKYMFKLVG